MTDKPYALFGGYNSSQIVGGAKGLKTFKNFENWLGTWALEGQGMYYGADPLQVPGEDVSYPAIIDTGSTRLSIPPDQFTKVLKVWKEAVPELKCTEGGAYCQVNDHCKTFKHKLKPLGFQMSDYVFEINPDQYLLESTSKKHKKCYFIIKKCRLPGKNKNLFLVGDTFLKHFYSVYDFDKDTVSLGINQHSKGKVSMFKPGERPDNLIKTLTSEDNMLQTKEHGDNTTQTAKVQIEVAPANVTAVQNAPVNSTATVQKTVFNATATDSTKK